jgi:hypothetical protein
VAGYLRADIQAWQLLILSLSQRVEHFSNQFSQLLDRFLQLNFFSLFTFPFQNPGQLSQLGIVECCLARQFN